MVSSFAASSLSLASHGPPIFFRFPNARYYDPAIGRFISADTVVPGNASGNMDGVAVKPLTVGFHETPFLSKLNQENKFGFWFELSDKQRQQVGSPWGPANPQNLNRYSYVQNNPLKYTDPTGHLPADAHIVAAWNKWYVDEMNRIDQKYDQLSRQVQEAVQAGKQWLKDNPGATVEDLKKFYSERISDPVARRAMNAAIDLAADTIIGAPERLLIVAEVYAQFALMRGQNMERAWATYRYQRAISSRENGVPMQPPPGYKCDNKRCWRQ